MPLAVPLRPDPGLFSNSNNWREAATSGPPSPSRRSPRQGDPPPHPPPGAVPEPHIAAVRAGNVASDGKTQPGASGVAAARCFAAEERLQSELEVLPCPTKTAAARRAGRAPRV